MEVKSDKFVRLYAASSWEASRGEMVLSTRSWLSPLSPTQELQRPHSLGFGSKGMNHDNQSNSLSNLPLMVNHRDLYHENVHHLRINQLESCL